jgi:omega-6 fatty acid desaturase (delta-12 desaturase)
MTPTSEIDVEPAADAAKAWRNSLPRERRRSTNFMGLVIFAVSAVAYVAFFLGIFLAPQPWMRIACVLLIPLTIGALFVIGHDAAHNSLTRSGWLNRLLARLSMLPAFHPYTSWTHAHNTLHHGGTCLKGKHPDFTPMSKEEFDALPRWRQWVYRFYRTPGGVGPCYVFDFYFRYLIFPTKAHRTPYTVGFHADRLLVFAFFIAQCWLAWELSAFTPNMIVPRWLQAVCGATLPWLSWIGFMGVASFVQHTHPRTAWYDNIEEWSFYHVQLKSSTHMVLPQPIGWILHNIMDHPAHHIDPTIPLYELPASQRLLEERTPEHSIVIPLTPWEFFRICRLCKLYDYRRHCWTDFDGNPTTPEGLHQRTTSEGPI